MKISQARKTRLISPSKFEGYDYCLNPYVGCSFGCAYCYVRFFIKDSEEPWGNFVRTRNHIPEKLEKEIQKIQNARIVMGTMTDPYQIIEKDLGLTRKCLEIIRKYPQISLGIYTRSPICTRDIELFKETHTKIHLTISPIPLEISKKLSPRPITLQSSFQTLQKLQENSIPTHVNIAPVLPEVSLGITLEIIDRICGMQVQGFFVDPMQPYKESLIKLQEICPEIAEIMQDKTRYTKIKDELHSEIRKRFKGKIQDIQGYLCDHERKIREKL